MGAYFSYQKFKNSETTEIHRHKFSMYNNVINEYKTKYINERYTIPVPKQNLFKPILTKIDEENTD